MKVIIKVRGVMKSRQLNSVKPNGLFCYGLVVLALAVIAGLFKVILIYAALLKVKPSL